MNIDLFKEQMLWRLEKFEVYKTINDFSQIIKTLDRLLCSNIFGEVYEPFVDGEIELIDFTVRNHEQQLANLESFEQIRSYIKQYKLEIALTYQSKTTIVIEELRSSFRTNTAMMAEYRLLAKLSYYVDVLDSEPLVADLCEKIEKVPKNCRHFIIIIKLNQLIIRQRESNQNCLQEAHMLVPQLIGLDSAGMLVVLKHILQNIRRCFLGLIEAGMLTLDAR